MKKIFEIEVLKNMDERDIQVEIDGRALDEITVGDILFQEAPFGVVPFTVISIYAYGRKFDKIYPTMGCKIFLSGKKTLSHVRYLYGE